MISIARAFELDVMVVVVSGSLDSTSCGRLQDALVAHVEEGWRKIVVDLSGLKSMSRAGVRPLTVTAKLMQTAGGQMRMCGATGGVRVLLGKSVPHHLARIDVDVTTSLLTLASNGVVSEPARLAA